MFDTYLLSLVDDNPIIAASAKTDTAFTGLSIWGHASSILQAMNILRCCFLDTHNLDVALLCM